MAEELQGWVVEPRPWRASFRVEPEWLNGSVWLLRKGTDFNCRVHSFERFLCQEANRLGLGAMVLSGGEPGSLCVRFFRLSPPPPLRVEEGRVGGVAAFRQAE